MRSSRGNGREGLAVLLKTTMFYFLLSTDRTSSGAFEERIATIELARSWISSSRAESGASAERFTSPNSVPLSRSNARFLRSPKSAIDSRSNARFLRNPSKPNSARAILSKARFRRSPKSAMSIRSKERLSSARLKSPKSLLSTLSKARFTR